MDLYFIFFSIQSDLKIVAVIIRVFFHDGSINSAKSNLSCFFQSEPCSSLFLLIILCVIITVYFCDGSCEGMDFQFILDATTENFHFIFVIIQFKLDDFSRHFIQSDTAHFI